MGMYYFYKAIHVAFMVYTTLLFIRIFSSWIPMLMRLLSSACPQVVRVLSSGLPQRCLYTCSRFVCFYTDPYLRVFQRIIPPIGGGLDLSPILAIFTLRIAESILLGLFR